MLPSPIIGGKRRRRRPPDLSHAGQRLLLLQVLFPSFLDGPVMLLARAKDLVAEGDLVRLSSHRLALKQDEEVAVARIEALFLKGGLAVPATSEVLAKSGVEAARARSRTASRSAANSAKCRCACVSKSRITRPSYPAG